MTPDAFVTRLSQLVAARRAREAGELTDEHLRSLAPSMTPEQIAEVADLMEWVDTMLDLDAAAQARMQPEPEKQSSRSA